MTQRWTDEFLQQMRKVGDPVADEVVRELFKENHITTVNLLLKDSVRNGDALPSNAPKVVRDYLTQTAGLPSWAKPDLIEKGERLFNRYGPQIIVVFHCYSLPYCYAARRGVQVLHLTTRLASHPERRIMETAQMIVDVMSPGGLTSKEGAGIRTAQKVRLMHAAVRKLILDRGQWNLGDLGLPVNQEDMAGTLNTFGWMVLDGLKKCGVNFTREEVEAYMHAWNVVGYTMGVREDLLPHSLEEGEELARTIGRRHFEACPEGQEMMAALLKMMEYQIPGDVFDGIPATLTRAMLGEEVSDILDVPPSDWTQAVLKPLRFLSMLSDAIGDQVSALAKLNEVFGQQLMSSLLWMNRGKDRPRFSVPTELIQTWKLNWVG